MTVTFPNPAHVASVWMPTVSPTKAGILSTSVALASMAALMALVAALFFGGCLERKFTWKHTLATLVVFLVAIFGLGWNRLTQSQTPNSAVPQMAQADALTSAKTSAGTDGTWIPSAKEVPAAGHKVQAANTWTDSDLQTISNAIEAQEHVKAEYDDASATINNSNMTPSDVAAHGTSYVTADGKKVRCAVVMGTPKVNNVGQPLTAEMTKIDCEPASS